MPSAVLGMSQLANPMREVPCLPIPPYILHTFCTSLLLSSLLFTSFSASSMITLGSTWNVSLEDDYRAGWGKLLRYHMQLVSTNTSR